MLARTIAWEILSDYRQATGNSKPLVKAEYAVVYKKLNDGTQGTCNHGFEVITVSTSAYDHKSTLIHELAHSYQGYTPKTDEQWAEYKAGSDAYWSDPDEVEARAVQALYTIRKESLSLYRKILRNKWWVRNVEAIADGINYGIMRGLSKGQRREVRLVRQKQSQWLP